MFSKLRKEFQKNHNLRTRFFRENKLENMKTNLHLLLQASIFALLLFVALLLVTPFIFPNWEPSLLYYSQIPVLGAFVLFSILYRKEKKQDPNIVQIGCILFCVDLLWMAISIDVFPYPDGTSTYMPFALIIIPILFILQYRYTLSLIIIAEAAYIILLFMFKSETTRYSDLFQSLVALAVSVEITSIVMQLRVKDRSEKFRFKKLSRMDKLTGVLNKEACAEEIRYYLEHMDSMQKCAIMILDLDDFKEVNDRLGHQSGDRVLREVGQILKMALRNTDVIGRLGGDEFMVLMKDVNGSKVIRKKCEKLETMVKRRMTELGFHNISCSMGVILKDEQVTLDYDRAYKISDESLYQAKKKKKGSYVLKEVNHTCYIPEKEVE